MNLIKEKLITSAKEMTNLKSLTKIALLLALHIVLAYFCSFYLTPQIKISTAFITTAMTGMLFGPVPAMLSAVAGDLIMFFLKSTGAPYFLGFALNAALGGLFWGIILYKNKFSLKRIILAKGLISVFVNCLLGTYWLTILYGDSYSVIFGPRVLKNITLFPLEVVLSFITLGALLKINKQLVK